ncbi:HMA2 domain-containing protein [Campylobacter geochelonis]|uniref:HMA2 domain-containing protein n=1 Tax=Campylobacter geochelonis TaxID=1780362 RepID=UPI00077086D4|nr:hypothetical protein [Campylobacter geochelonis]CZE48545.1 Uncharacterised protein [Campylobacter geochelonis]CZE51155.1 Uncharacterised protein [Campylobacter geochelonis]
MTELQNSEILEFAKYFSPISHTKGRLRVRVSPKIKELKSNIDESKIHSSIKNIKGIKELKTNLLVGSITIFYDHEVFPMRLWNDFLNGQNTDELREYLNLKAKEIV